MNPSATSGTPPHAVLVVDDEPAVLDVVAQVLRRQHVVYEAITAEAAQAVLNRLGDRIAVVVCDYALPGADGVTFLQRVAEGHPMIQRVMLTGHIEVDVLLGALNDAHLQHFLPKPVAPDRLLEVVAAAIAEYEDLQKASRMVDEYVTEERRRTSSLRRCQRRLCETASIFGLVARGMLTVFLGGAALIGVLGLAGVAVLLILYALKSLLGIDLTAGHLEELLRR